MAKRRKRPIPRRRTPSAKKPAKRETKRKPVPKLKVKPSAKKVRQHQREAAALREAYELAREQAAVEARERRRELREAYELAREQAEAEARERRRQRRRPTGGMDVIPPKKPKKRKPGTFGADAEDFLTLPPKQRRGERLTPDQLIPTEPWRRAPNVRKWTRNFRFDRAFHPVESPYREGEAAWFPLPEHTALHMVLSGQHAVTIENIKEHAIQVFRQSGRHHMRFRALLLYWYPDNPNYRGAMVRVTVGTPEGGSKVVERNMQRLARTWKPMWTKWMFGSTPDGVATAVDAAFYRENQNGVSPAVQAEERVIYLIAYELYTFDNVTPPTESFTGSPLRAVE
jgi:hypothetical protein